MRLEDELNEQDEDKYIKVIEQILLNDIDASEREALLAIRNEMIRKHKVIDSAFKDMNKLNHYVD